MNSITFESPVEAQDFIKILDDLFPILKGVGTYSKEGFYSMVDGYKFSIHSRSLWKVEGSVEDVVGGCRISMKSKFDSVEEGVKALVLGLMTGIITIVVGRYWTSNSMSYADMSALQVEQWWIHYLWTWALPGTISMVSLYAFWCHRNMRSQSGDLKQVLAILQQRSPQGLSPTVQPHLPITTAQGIEFIAKLDAARFFDNLALEVEDLGRTLRGSWTIKNTNVGHCEIHYDIQVGKNREQGFYETAFDSQHHKVLLKTKSSFPYSRTGSIILSLAVALCSGASQIVNKDPNLTGAFSLSIIFGAMAFGFSQLSLNHDKERDRSVVELIKRALTRSREGCFLRG